MNAYDAIIWTLYQHPTTRPLALMDADLMTIFAGLLGLVTMAVGTLTKLLLSWQKDSRESLIDLSQAVGALSSEVVDLRFEVEKHRGEQVEANNANTAMREDLREIRSFIVGKAFGQSR